MSDTLLVSTRKGLFTVSRKAGQWAITGVDFLGDNVSLALADRRDGRRYAALDLGHFGVKLHRSTRDGWEEIAAPAYPPKPDGDEEKRFWGRPLNWSTARIWARPAAPTSRARSGAERCPAACFARPITARAEMVRALWDHPKRKKWMGGGADLPGIHSICVDPRNSSASRSRSRPEESGSPRTPARAGCSAARACAPNTWRRSWPTTRSPRMSIASCNVRGPAAHRVQHHNGIFGSSDAGKTFSEITGVEPWVFGFQVVVRPGEPETACVVPEIKDEKRIPRGGKLVVTRTRDGGKSFDVLSRGLPQSHAYDIVYRHALALDAAGDRLAFGSTTGGLWVSEDQGDGWACVTHTLPPVYAVQFA